ncbi:hypothetical protein FMEAI12_5580002 [Parafrankia sp. Ea1.12]|nr:hypothetical protein FMEAI12_5580002 [Parafrankia sp. Ea1.12]
MTAGVTVRELACGIRRSVPILPRSDALLARGPRFRAGRFEHDVIVLPNMIGLGCPSRLSGQARSGGPGAGMSPPVEE